MKKWIILCLFILPLSRLAAQDVFVAKGKIEFEKSFSIHRSAEALAEADPDAQSYADYIKQNAPAVAKSYFDLYFDGTKTMYKEGREAPEKVEQWCLPPCQDNIVFTDLEKHQVSSIKNVYESSFLVQDSLRKIDWRITMDTRNIAGFECQKAVGKIMDSVYVIAFYTDEILTEGGPESFNGLPGMILGLAIPRIQTTWFATKLELTPVKAEDLAEPKKGKKINSKELLLQLKDVMKNWGRWGQRNIWNIMI